MPPGSIDLLRNLPGRRQYRNAAGIGVHEDRDEASIACLLQRFDDRAEVQRPSAGHLEQFVLLGQLAGTLAMLPGVEHHHAVAEVANETGNQVRILRLDGMNSTSRFSASGERQSHRNPEVSVLEQPSRPADSLRGR